MILIDIAQVSLSNLFRQLGNHTNTELDENLIRHMILNSLRAIRKKFQAEFGELVIACDSRSYWRKRRFPHYKSGRKKERDASEIDWPHVFDCLKRIRDELREFFPYRVIDVEGAEADDVIGTLCREYANTGEKILIISGDKDFIQLQRYTNVFQYDPVGKSWIKHNDPEGFLFEHVLRGDAGDGVPNFRSPDDTLVNGQRQNRVSTALVARLRAAGIGETTLSETELRNYSRNRELIDLDCIPRDVYSRVLEEYEAQAGKDRSRMFDYFIKNRLRNLMESINDF